MAKIIINSFAQIKSDSRKNTVEALHIDSALNVVIGRQASGKSTLVKLVCFCKKIRDYLLEYLLDDNNFQGQENEDCVSFLKFLTKKYVGYFGKMKYFCLEKIDVVYLYSEEEGKNGKSVRICMDGETDPSGESYIRFTFSKPLEEAVVKLLRETGEFYKQHRQQPVSTDVSLVERYYYVQKWLRTELIERTNAVFSEDGQIVYIPAGRSMLTALFEQSVGTDIHFNDLTMQEFIDTVLEEKKRFSCSLEEVIANYKKTVAGQINDTDIELAKNFVYDILKGTYVCDKQGEKIYYDSEHWVKLMYASSGQQEVLWILLILFSDILQHKKSFVVIEEPEAHLFPEAQLELAKLIALFINSTGSSVFVTTHSPYILTSFNLLLCSYSVENSPKCKKEETVVEPKCRLNPESVGSYLIVNEKEGFSFDEIKDIDRTIDASKIDGASEKILDAEDKIIGLKVKYDL